MNVLSLFDGMSCGRVALERAGIRVKNYFASEIDKYTIKVSKANYPDIIHLGDVRDINWFGLPKIDLLIGGSPCQGFSFAGKGLNFEDERSKLFFEFVRILEEVQPTYFLLENVRMKKEWQDIISQLLRVEPVMINSALVSAQSRKRLYWTNIPNITQPNNKCQLLKDIIENNVDRKYYISGKQLITITNHERLKSGFTAINPKKALCQLSRQYSNWNGTYVTGCAMRGRYLVDGKRADKSVESLIGLTEQKIEIRIDSKSNCLTTVSKDSLIKIGYLGKGGQGNRIYSLDGKSSCLSAMGGGQGAKTGLYVDNSYCTVDNNCGIRRLTPVECERLQTVPDNYTACVSDSQRYKMLGNGWTIDVIVHILRNIG